VKDAVDHHGQTDADCRIMQGERCSRSRQASVRARPSAAFFRAQRVFGLRWMGLTAGNSASRTMGLP
jgi:hypothetical protein